MSQRIEGLGPSDLPKKTDPLPASSDDITLKRAPADIKVEAIEGGDVPDLSQFMKTGRLDPLDDAALSEFRESVNLMAGDLDKLMGVVESFSPEEAPQLEEWAQKNSKELVEAAMKHVEAAESLTTAWDGFMEFPLTGAELAESYIAAPLEKIIGPFEQLEKYTKSTAVGIMDAQLVLQVPQMLGKTAGLIYKRIVLKHAKAQVEILLKSENPEEVAKAKKLKGWLELQDKKLTEDSLELGLELLAYTPKGLKALLITLDKFPQLVAYGDLWMAAVTGIVLNSYKIYKAHKAVKTQEEWLQEIRQAPLVTEAITEDEGPPEALKTEIHKLLKQRKASFESKKEGLRAEFTQWIYAELHEHADFNQLLSVLKEKGVHPDQLEEPIRSSNDLLAALKMKGVQSDQLLIQYTEHKRTVSTLTRQAVKTLSEKKQRIEKEANQFELSKSKVALAVSILSFAAIITLKTLAMVGLIALPAAAMSGLGAGLFIIGLAILALGLIYLYRTRPHLFKEFFRGTQIRIALYEIPMQIDQFVVKIKQIKQLKESLKLMEFRAQSEELKGILETSESVEVAALPKKLKPLFNQLKSKASKKLEEADIIEAKRNLEAIEEKAVAESTKRQEELDRDIQKWTEKAEKWKKKLEPLQKRIREAGSKDFARAARLAEDRTGNPLKIEEVIVEGLFNDTDLLDEDTKRILQKELGVDLQEIRSNPDVEKVKQDTLEALKTFFAMDNSKIVSFIREQKAKERYT